MKILFVSPSYKPAYIYGGPAVSVSELAEALAAEGHAVTIYTTTANGQEELEVETSEPVQVNGVTVHYFKRQTGDHTHISFGLWKKLWSTASNFDTINLQSWWSILIIGAAAICKIKKCNYFISPRGMLSSYSFQQQHSFPKKLIHKTVGLPLLKTSLLHATTQLEWEDCLRVNNSWQGFILPNIVKFPKNVVKIDLTEKKEDCLIFGFLSRVDPKKGIELLFEGLSQVKFDFRLKIAGMGEEGYVASLKKIATVKGISSKIEWCGWKNGDEKFQFLQTVDVFVLTSYNENFANTVVESLAVGTPVLLTNGVGLADYVEKNNLGWICETNITSITESLNRIYAERLTIFLKSKAAPDIIKANFDKQYLAHQYSDLYKQFA